MNEFIEKNKGLLRFYCIATRIIGWALLFLSIILAISLVRTGRFGNFSSLAHFIHKRTLYITTHPSTREQADLLSLVTRFFLPGLLMLGLGQFIRYLSEKNFKPSWTLRCGEGILYLYAVLILCQVILNYVLSPSMQANRFIVDGTLAGVYQAVPLHILTSVLLTAMKVVVLVGLGQILARTMPVIEESKTLV